MQLSLRQSHSCSFTSWLLDLTSPFWHPSQCVLSRSPRPPPPCPRHSLRPTRPRLFLSWPTVLTLCLLSLLLAMVSLSVQKKILCSRTCTDVFTLVQPSGPAARVSTSVASTTSPAARPTSLIHSRTQTSVSATLPSSRSWASTRSVSTPSTTPRTTMIA